MSLAQIFPPQAPPARSALSRPGGMYVNAVVWDEARERVILGLQSGGLFTCKLDAGDVLVPEHEGKHHDKPILRVAVADDHVISAGWEGQLARARAADLGGAQRYEGHADRVLAFAADGGRDLLASGGHDQILRVWSLGGATLRFASPKRAFWITEIAFLPDGLLACVVGFNALEIRDPIAGSLVHAIAPRGLKPSAMALSPDGRAIALGGAAGGVAVIDVASRAERWRVELGGENASVAFADDGHVVAATGNAVTRVDPEGRVRTLGSHDAAVVGVCAVPGGRALSWGLDRRVSLWRLDGDGALVDEHDDHVAGCKAAVAITDGKGLALVSGDLKGTVRVLRPEAGAAPARAPVHAGPAAAVYLTGRALLSSATDGVRRWSLDGGAHARIEGTRGGGRLVPSGGGRVIAVGPGASAREIDATTGRVRRKVGDDRTVHAALPLPGGDALLAGEGFVRRIALDGDMPTRWRTDLGEAPFRRIAPHGAEAALAGADDGRVVAVDLATGAVRWELAAHGQPVTRLETLPGGAFATACAGRDEVRIWPPGAREPSREIAGAAALAAHAPSGTFVVGALDGRVRRVLPDGADLDAFTSELAIVTLLVEDEAVFVADREGNVERWQRDGAGWSRAWRSALGVEPSAYTELWRCGALLLCATWEKLGMVDAASGDAHEPFGKDEAIAVWPGARETIGVLDTKGNVFALKLDAKKAPKPKLALQDGAWRAIVLADGRLLVWNVHGGVALHAADKPAAIARERAHRAAVAGAAPAADGIVTWDGASWAIGWGADGAARWQTRVHDGATIGVGLGAHVLIGCDDGAVAVVEAASGRLAAKHAFDAAGHGTVARSADGTRAAFGGWGGHVAVLVEEAGAVRFEAIGQLHKGRVRAVAFAPDEDALYTAGDDALLRWSRGEKTLLRPKPGVRAMCALPGGRLAFATSAGQVVVWDVAAGEAVEVGAIAGEGTAITVDGDRLAVADSTGAVRVLQLRG
ncbi:MAG: PQQ-binding-like beta-propeller repeat protein [Minicystis sp.]